MKTIGIVAEGTASETMVLAVRPTSIIIRNEGHATLTCGQAMDLAVHIAEAANEMSASERATFPGSLLAMARQWNPEGASHARRTAMAEVIRALYKASETE